MVRLIRLVKVYKRYQEQKELEIENEEREEADRKEMLRRMKTTMFKGQVEDLLVCHLHLYTSHLTTLLGA